MKLPSKTILVPTSTVMLAAVAITGVAQSVSDTPVTQTLMLVLIGAGMLAAVVHRLKSM